MSDNPWQPVHHEDLAEETEEQKPAATSKRKGGAEKAAPATPPGLNLMLSMPPELVELSKLSGAIEDVAAEVAEQGAAITSLAESMQSALKDLVGSLAEQVTKQSDLIDELLERLHQQDDHLATLSKQIKESHDVTGEIPYRIQHALKTQGDEMAGKFQSLEATIAAPRKVTLQRDANGVAKAAVSEMVKPGKPKKLEIN